MRFLADESVRGDIVRGLRLHLPDLSLVRVQDVGLRSASDPEILEWASREGCIVLALDYATFPDHAFECVAAGKAMPGVFMFASQCRVSEIIAELEMVLFCSEAAEWEGKVVYLPW